MLFLFLETLFLAVWRQRTGRGPAPLALVFAAGGGASLILALKFALQETGWTGIAASLLAALAFHLADLASRWRSALPDR